MATATPNNARPPVRRTQTERRETAERKILDAAIGIIAERGLSGLTLAAAGEAAGYSRGIASHHFGKKDQLLVALVKYITSRFSLSLSERPMDGLPMIESVISEYFARAARDSRSIRALHLVLAEGISNPLLQEPLAHANERSLKGLTLHLQKAREAGDIRVAIEPRAEAIMILAGLRGITAQWLIDDQHIDLTQMRDQFIAATRRSLSA